MNLPAILSYGGMAVFVVVLVTNFAFLLWDAWLWAWDGATISDQSWSKPVLAWGILGWQAIGVIGLTVHLFIDPHGVTSP